MNIGFEQKVRERAYEIWIATGMGDGMSLDHWVAAEQDLSQVPAPKAIKSVAAKAPAKAMKATASKAPPAKVKAAPSKAKTDQSKVAHAKTAQSKSAAKSPTVVTTTVN